MTKHWFIGHLTSKFSKGKKLGLDVGCGSRNWHEYFRCKYLGIDVHKDTKPDICASATHLPFKENIFDFATCYSVLPYVKEGDRVLDEIHSVVKPNGVVIVIIMNLRGLKLHPATHFPNPLNSKQLNQKLKMCGFKTILHKNLKEMFLALYYNLTSVYAFNAVIVDKK